MVNNGSLHYDHDRDGTHSQVSGCTVSQRVGGWESGAREVSGCTMSQRVGLGVHGKPEGGAWEVIEGPYLWFPVVLLQKLQTRDLCGHFLHQQTTSGEWDRKPCNQVATSSSH